MHALQIVAKILFIAVKLQYCALALVFVDYIWHLIDNSTLFRIWRPFWAVMAIWKGYAGTEWPDVLQAMENVLL